MHVFVEALLLGRMRHSFPTLLWSKWMYSSKVCTFPWEQSDSLYQPAVSMLAFGANMMMFDVLHKVAMQPLSAWT